MLNRVYLGNTPSTDESHTKLETMMVDLAQQMTTVKHEQEYMEVRERIHTYVSLFQFIISYYLYLGLSTKTQTPVLYCGHFSSQLFLL